LELKSRYTTIIGLVVSAVFLYLAFRNSDFREIWQVTRRTNPWLLLASLPWLAVHFWLRAVRWRYLLKPVGQPPVSSLFGATLIGFMANNVLPLRVGEFVRAFVLARRERLTVSGAFATLVVERIFDGLFLLMLFIGVLLILPLELSSRAESWVRALAYAGGGLYLTAVAFIVLIKWKAGLAVRVAERLLGPFPRLKEAAAGVIEAFASGLKSINEPRLLLIISAYSLVIWLTCAGYYYMTLLAFPSPAGGSLGDAAGPLGSIFVLGAIAFGVMLPSSPGFVGTYQFACIIALTAMGASSAAAEGYAIVSHAVQYIAVTVSGIACLQVYKFSFQDIRRGGEIAQERVEEGIEASVEAGPNQS
jgi:hypothetical protein